MPDRHKTKPLSLRLPEALSAWVEQQVQATGKPVRRVILDALETERLRSAGGPGHHDGDSEQGNAEQTVEHGKDPS